MENEWTREIEKLRIENSALVEKNNGLADEMKKLVFRDRLRCNDLRRILESLAEISAYVKIIKDGP